MGVGGKKKRHPSGGATYIKYKNQK